MPTFSTILLPLSIAIPLGIGLFVVFTQKLPNRVARVLTQIAVGLPLLIALSLALNFTPDPETGYAFFSRTNTGLETLGITLALGLNGISLPLFVMAALVGASAGIFAVHRKTERHRLFLGLLLIMHSGLLGLFASVDVFFFYFFHELALIPTFIMIGIWGSSARRLAAMEMTIYLTLGALLSLLGLIALYWQSGAQTFDLIALREHLASQPLRESFQGVIFPLLLFGFGILVSLFPLHSWAPRGYAAAPTATAMLHAGVLKKFGLYGLLQISVPLIPAGAAQWAPTLAVLALCNILIIGFITMAQRDLKQMLGFSSVMHMGYIFLGIVSFNLIGHGGAVILMFAHGLSVALLFLLADCVRERTRTYDMQEMGGLAQHTPILAAFFIAAMFASIGLPGFANFWGEFTIFLGLWEYSPILVALAAIGIIISAIYGLRAVAAIFYGSETDALTKKIKNREEPITDLVPVERIAAGLLFVALLWIGIYPKPISDPANEALMLVAPPKVESIAHIEPLP